MSVAEIDPCSCFSIAFLTIAVTVLCTATSNSHSSIKTPAFLLCFCPFGFSIQSVAERHFLTNRPISSHFCSVALSTDSEAQSPLFIKYSWICFFWQAMPKAHTHFHSRKSYQTLSKTFSVPLIHSSSYWYMHISMNVIHWYWYWYCSIFANFKIFCAQSESLICCSSPVNPKRASSEFQI